ncbi:MAG: hypothetical protein ACK5QH_04265 [Rubrivivax sp.]
MTPSLPTSPGALAVVAYDAGAANVLLPWLAHLPGARAFMQGPAEALWRQRYPERPLCGRLEDALADAELVLTGTGWASTLEHDARVLAVQQGRRSVAVIDHWVNYPLRFERGGVQQWPDEFWLTDADALAIAAQHFPADRLRLFDNLYLAEQAAAMAPVPAHGDVLVVLEPARSDWGQHAPDGGPGEPGEFQALRYFMQRRALLCLPSGLPVRLRPHPSDPPGKYAAWLASAEGQGAVLDSHPTLAQALGPARWVVGGESMALVVALASGRQAISHLPPWAPACRLPHRGLLHIRAL